MVSKRQLGVPTVFIPIQKSPVDQANPDGLLRVPVLLLKKLYTVSSTEIHALGDGSSLNESSDSPSLKKESNGKFIYTLKRGVNFCKF
jgi:hypothetical protein